MRCSQQQQPQQQISSMKTMARPRLKKNKGMKRKTSITKTSTATGKKTGSRITLSTINHVLLIIK